MPASISPGKGPPGGAAAHTRFRHQNGYTLFPLVDLGAGPGDPIYVAAHANVEDRNKLTAQGDLLENLSTSLVPYNSGGGMNGDALLTVAFPGGDSYFNSTVGNGGDFDGTYDGWCVDTNTTISPGTTYCTELVSSYDDFANDLVNVP